MLAEPPFPLCPCWMCIGDFTCCALLCGQEVPAAIATLLTVNPLIMLRTPGSIAALATSMIRTYQTEVSAHTPPRCRYRPTCSNYGLTALERFGLVRGLWLTGRRLARCRTTVPPGSIDLVPARATVVI